MIILYLFSFIAGIVTVLSPCIFPILPLVLSSGTDIKSKLKPYGIILGFVFSFTFFTLFLSQIIKLTGIGADGIRLVAVIILLIFGISYFIKGFNVLFEQLFSKLAVFTPTNVSNDFFGGLLLGMSLGLVWTPCVGPILASVISLSLIGSVTIDTFLTTLFYSLGTALPMFLIIMVGNKLTKKFSILKNTSHIQKVFAFIMIITAVLIYFKLDKTAQVWFNNLFPNYYSFVTSIENSLHSIINK